MYHKKVNKESQQNSLKKIPEFSMMTFFESKEIYSKDIFRDNDFYLINIWASWCVPCRDEHQFLVSLSKNNRLEIIGIKEKVIWPVYDKKLIQEEEINIVVQINGKKREILRSQINTSEENLLKLIMTNDKLNKYLNNKTIKKKIYIKDKLINIIL